MDDALGLSDEELLLACQAERRQSAGFEEDAVLLGERIQALNYSKGEMPDLPCLPNRSHAVSTDVADAIETALPDLIEIFTGGDDVLAFLPNGPADEKPAEQETDYVKKVIFEDNPGFEILYDMFKDALQVKTGVAMAWWEDRDPEVEDFEGNTTLEVAMASMGAQILDLRPDPADGEGGEPTFSFTAVTKIPGRLRIKAIAPEDFTVGRDTVSLREATYCAYRARPRAQDLIEQGVDREIVDALPAYGTGFDESQRLARDTAGENADQRSIDGGHDLRQVEVVTHFLKIDADGTGPKLWRVVSGAGETVLLSREPARRINIAAITPYPTPHRFYGQSLADKLVELQRQRTALKRILLDSGYFALNQRMEVALDRASQWTVSDLLRNEPMVPVRSKTGDAVRPITAGPLNFDVLQALEYSATEAEQRTGIVRGAQGLNPDTLHDTAHGVLALIQASQKRLRLIARIFAETGIRDLYLLVHALLREHAEAQQIARLRGAWVPVDPTSWGERSEMAIKVGSGSAGLAQEIQILTNLGVIQKEIIQAQGGPAGPLVTLQNVYNLAVKIAEKSGEKAPERFFTDPTQAPAPAGPPAPHPEALKAMAAAQRAQAELAQTGQIEGAKLQLEQQRTNFEVQLRQGEAGAAAAERAARLELETEKARREDAFRHAQLAADAALRREEMALRAQLEREKTAGAFGKAVTVQHMQDESDAAQRNADVTVQALKSADVAKLSGEGDAAEV